MSAFENLMDYKTKPNIGKRIFAGCIDYAIIWTFFFVFIVSFGVQNIEGGYTVNGLPALVPLLFWALMTIGTEQLFGATIGNMLVELKPVSINGIDDKLSIGQSVIRHLLDPIDMFLFGLIGILIINNSERNQRVGDIAAKTIVIESYGK